MRREMTRIGLIVFALLFVWIVTWYIVASPNMSPFLTRYFPVVCTVADTEGHFAEGRMWNMYQRIDELVEVDGKRVRSSMVVNPAGKRFAWYEELDAAGAKRIVPVPIKSDTSTMPGGAFSPELGTVVSCSPWFPNGSIFKVPLEVETAGI